MSQPSDTKLALVEAAGQLFAEQGFDAVSTRMIADKAGVNLGGIHYHFGSKEKLYVAAFRHVAVSFKSTCFEDVAEERPELMDTPQGVVRIIRMALKTLFRDIMSPLEDSWKRALILRELFSSSSALPTLSRDVFKPKLDRDIDFFRKVRPDVAEATLIIWGNMLHAQMVFYLQAQDVINLSYGPLVSGTEFYDKAAWELGSALILLLGLPLEVEKDV